MARDDDRRHGERRGGYSVDGFTVRYLGDDSDFDGVVLVALDQDQLSTMRRRIVNDRALHDLGMRALIFVSATAGLFDAVWQVAHH